MISAGVGCLIALAGCGSSGGSSSAGGASSAGGSGEASKSPDQILTDSASALRGAHSYVMQGQIHQFGHNERVRVVASSGSLDVMLAGDAGRAEVILLPSGVYINADQAFWAAHGVSRGGILAGHWIQVPPSDAQSVAASLAQFQPSTAARCLVENHGTLSTVGKLTVDGKPAVVVKDAGNVPGDSAGTLAVATSGPPYPLRVIDSGPHRAGGRIDICNDGRPDNSRGVLTFSQFGQAPAVTAPSHAIPLGQASGVA